MLYQNNWFWCLEPNKIYFVVTLKLNSEGSIFNPTKKVKKPILYFFNLGWNFENSDFTHLFDDETKLKIQQKEVKNKKFWHIFDQIWRKKGLIVHFPPIVHIAKNQWMKNTLLLLYQSHYTYAVQVCFAKKAFTWLFFYFIW